MQKEQLFREKLNEMLRAYRVSCVLLSAFELGIFEILSKSDMTTEKLSAELNIPVRSLNMLLGALAALNLIKLQNDHWRFTEQARPYTDPGSPEYLGGLMRHELRLQKRWMQLTESVRSGLPAKKEPEKPQPGQATAFINAMADIGRYSAQTLIETLPFRGNERLLDLGGGPGQYIARLAEQFPEMQVTLFDQAETIETAGAALANHPNLKNMHFIAGDIFRDPYGENYDIILISNVMHIFSREQNIQILKKCRRALKNGAKIYIKDFLLNDDRQGPLSGTLFSLHMLLSTEGGSCYSKKEYRDMLRSAGFTAGKTYTFSEKSIIIEGIKND